ncbi:ankyrin repeat domain-containing protein [Leptospira licerasiae]|uniref:ankyrin repeat domain-containing protein n=1 Tax=Leptospira licerasiae TaxID=447106 RepID=UPI000248A948|nr:ankyrin repeat domain-containing protein [Leptospira licerasiae]EIE02502.1 ankyrin repeat protein [Leptospira licerasiae serovar Varillal str. VAR 010]
MNLFTSKSQFPIFCIKGGLLFLWIFLTSCISPQFAMSGGGGSPYPSDFVYKGDLFGLQNCLRAGYSVDTRDPFTRNFTPLMIAAREGEVEIAEFLVRNGADINAKTRDGHTALMMAVYNRNLDIVKLLLKNGANVHIKSKQGHTAFSEASLEEAIQIKELLLPYEIGPKR